MLDTGRYFSEGLAKACILRDLCCLASSRVFFIYASLEGASVGTGRERRVLTDWRGVANGCMPSSGPLLPWIS